MWNVWATTDQSVTLGLKANWNLEKCALGEKTSTFGPSENTKYKGKDLGSRFTGGVRRKFLIIGWNFLVLHHDIEYNCVHTLLAVSKARFASLARFWLTLARLCINRVTKIATRAACCLGTVSNPGFIAVRFRQQAHRFWPSVYQSETDARIPSTSLTRENTIDKFRGSRFNKFNEFKSLGRLAPISSALKRTD